jgi:hypothetical protein
MHALLKNIKQAHWASKKKWKFAGRKDLGSCTDCITVAIEAFADPSKELTAVRRFQV